MPSGPQPSVKGPWHAPLARFTQGPAEQGSGAKRRSRRKAPPPELGLAPRSTSSPLPSSRSLKLGGSFARGDLSQMERSVGRLRSMHSKMLMDIEKVQIHFGGSVKASSQMIRELLHAQCLSHPCYKR